jgi:hypothetical protein
MNHDEACLFFDTLGADITIGRPPAADLIAQGRAEERRRTRRTVGLVAASIALVISGAAAVQQAGAGDGDDMAERLCHRHPADPGSWAWVAWS